MFIQPNARVGGPGAITRKNVPGSVVETALLTPFDQPGAIWVPGVAVAIDATTGMARALVASDTGATIWGMLCANYPRIPRDLEGPCSVMRRGYMLCRLFGSTGANLGQPVYARVAKVIWGTCIGGIEAAPDPDGVSTIRLQAKFTGPADADGITEICYRLV